MGTFPHRQLNSGVSVVKRELAKGSLKISLASTKRIGMGKDWEMKELFRRCPRWAEESGMGLDLVWDRSHGTFRDVLCTTSSWAGLRSSTVQCSHDGDHVSHLGKGQCEEVELKS